MVHHAIRLAGPDDAPALADLAAATFPLACPPGADPAAIADFIAEHLSEERFDGYLADPERFVFVARPDDGGALLGYTMSVLGEPYDPEAAAAVRLRPTCELSKAYVLAEHHGHGVASDLMTASLAEAERRGAAGVWLGVNQLNVRAQKFYAKHGFARVGVKHFQVGAERHDDYVMERALT